MFADCNNCKKELEGNHNQAQVEVAPIIQNFFSENDDDVVATTPTEPSTTPATTTATTTQEEEEEEEEKICNTQTSIFVNRIEVLFAILKPRLAPPPGKPGKRFPAAGAEDGVRECLARVDKLDDQRSS